MTLISKVNHNWCGTHLPQPAQTSETSWAIDTVKVAFLANVCRGAQIGKGRIFTKVEEAKWKRTLLPLIDVKLAVSRTFSPVWLRPCLFYCYQINNSTVTRAAVAQHQHSHLVARSSLGPVGDGSEDHCTHLTKGCRLLCIHPGCKTHGQSHPKSETVVPTKWWIVTTKTDWVWCDSNHLSLKCDNIHQLVSFIRKLKNTLIKCVVFHLQ